MISVICASNNEQLYNGMLLPSINKQTVKDFEVIKLDAAALGLKGAAQTLNYGAKIAKGDVLVFVHQDVEFISDRFFEELISFSQNNDFAIAGVAGAVLKGKQVYSSVVMDKGRYQAGIKITAVREADSVDECLFVIKKSEFKGFRDYGSWHFYAVEYSLRAAEAGEKILLFPLEIWHLSPGWSFDASYWETLKKVGEDFPKRKCIPTTVSFFPNTRAWWFKQRVKRWINRIKKRFKK